MDSLVNLSNQYIVIAVLIGIASGVIGSFAILKRMALVGDALSHVALPGIALAIAWRVDPFWGALLLLVLAAVFVWWIEGRTKLPGDAIVGLLFTASLAAGILGIPDEEILDSLFGSFPPLDDVQFILVALAAVFMTVLMMAAAKKTLFSIFAPDIAAISGPKRSTTLVFLILFATVVALGIKLVGTLLMGALTIIPASVAKVASRSMTSYVVLSGFIGGAVAGTGTWLAASYHLAPGPIIILIGVGLFFLAITFRRE